jgi:hypothetical protein
VGGAEGAPNHRADSGGGHYWLDTNHGRIRKPAGTFAIPEGN